jgi:hypothetical protein
LCPTSKIKVEVENQKLKAQLGDVASSGKTPSCETKHIEDAQPASPDLSELDVEAKGVKSIGHGSVGHNLAGVDASDAKAEPVESTAIVTGSMLTSQQAGDTTTTVKPASSGTAPKEPIHNDQAKQL